MGLCETVFIARRSYAMTWARTILGIVEDMEDDTTHIDNSATAKLILNYVKLLRTAVVALDEEQPLELLENRPWD